MDYEKVYGEMHENVKYFPGVSVCEYSDLIRGLVEKHSAQKLLDYGSGKGFQYLVHRVHEAWGTPLPTLYDPGVRQLSKKPPKETLFDGIICSDVLEHVEASDLPGVFQDLTDYMDEGRKYGAFAFLVICCRPSRKKLPDGRDVHVTIRPEEWWDELIRRYNRPGRHFYVAYDHDQRNQA